MGTRPWLPEAAMTLERIGAALAEPLDQWSNMWFASNGCAMVGDSPMSLAAHGEGNLNFEAEGLNFVVPAIGKRRLLEAILGVTLTNVLLTPADHRVLDKFAGRACQDLLERFVRMPAIASAPTDSIRRICIMLDGEECGRLSLPSSALVALSKSVIPRSPTIGIPLESRRNAIRSCHLTVDALLGRAALTIEEVRGLEVGDVIILDSALETLLPVRLVTTGTMLGKGELSKAGEHNALIWQEYGIERRDSQ